MTPDANLSCSCGGQYEHVASGRGEYFKCAECGDVLGQVSDIRQIAEDAKDDKVSELAKYLLGEGIDK
jgi:tRNA(Ile2) C34 agmatinyltransferase TiaS